MPRLPPVLIPAELEMDLSAPKTLDLRYDGDVRLCQTLGRMLGAVWAGGDLTLEVPLVTGTCVSGGVLRTGADVDAVRLSARELHLSGRSIRARALSASERIIIKASVLKVDVIIAPVIEIHHNASGRVTVIESHNDRNTAKIKGCFTLAEYEELFGDSETFLSARGVAPLRDRSKDHLDELHDLGAIEELDDLDMSSVEPLDDTSSPTALSGLQGVELLDADAIETLDDGSDHGTVEEYQGAIIETIEDEDEGVIQEIRRAPSPRSPSPLRSPPPRRAPTPSHARRRGPSPLIAPPRTESAVGPWLERMRDIVVTISDGYAPYPPRPLLELQGLIEEGRRSELERALPEVWQQLILHHRQKQAPVNPRVSHGFRVLNDLLEVGPT